MEQAYAITHSQAIGIQDDPELNTLYKAYAGKLLGYILAVVENRGIADDCFVKVFTDIYRLKQNGTNTYRSNTWCWLMNLARQHINDLQDSSQNCLKDNKVAALSGDDLLNEMSAAQQRIFCGVYYHRKTVAELANELNIAEPAVRLLLKEAFTIIRRAR